MTPDDDRVLSLAERIRRAILAAPAARNPEIAAALGCDPAYVGRVRARPTPARPLAARGHGRPRRPPRRPRTERALCAACGAAALRGRRGLPYGWAADGAGGPRCASCVRAGRQAPPVTVSYLPGRAPAEAA